MLSTQLSESLLDPGATKEQQSLMETFHEPGTDYENNEEPRFLEQVQMFLDEAASKVVIEPDMLKYILSCDHALRF
jgi:hypothetical protein